MREKASHRVATMCRMLGVSTSGYYAWLRRPQSKRSISNASLTQTIEAIWVQSRKTYGSPRIHAELRLDHGLRCGKQRVERLMRAAGIEGCHRRKKFRTTKRDPAARPAPDLVDRNFKVKRVDELWVADITYISTWSGWLYLAVVIDAFSRKVIGWSMRDDLTTDLVCEAFDMAVWNRRPAPGVIHHSDQGCQYTSFGFGRSCRQAGIVPSMGSIGDAFDNAVAESFFATLETELLWRQSFPTRAAARVAVFDYIEGFYNPRRRHSSLEFLSPVAYERRWSDEVTAA